MSLTTLTSGLTSTVLRKPLRVYDNCSGEEDIPTHLPLTKTFALSLIFAGSNCWFKLIIPYSSKKSMIGFDALPTEIYDIKDKFFTRPQACPSGVSEGHTIPQ